MRPRHSLVAEILLARNHVEHHRLSWHRRVDELRSHVQVTQHTWYRSLSSEIVG